MGEGGGGRREEEEEEEEGARGRHQSLRSKYSRFSSHTGSPVAESRSRFSMVRGQYDEERTICVCRSAPLPST